MTKQPDSAKRERHDRLVLEITPSQFEMAYQAWRDQLCDDALDGIPIADATGDFLFQAVVQQLQVTS